MMYKMKLIEDEYNNVKYVNKIVEIMLNDEKRKNEKSGDKIIFYKLPNMEERILVNVEQTFIFASILEAYSSFPKRYFGYKDISMNQILKKIYKIYTKEEEKILGVMAIKFRL